VKFSILLPTRNRLELLRHAIETVRRQDYDDWEVIVSDNFSEQDIAGYVRSLNEPRVRYYRTGSFVPVTDNWNNALEKSTGDFIVMLGDDDCLMRGCLSTLRGLIDRHGTPDFIYTNAFLYAYPGVIPTHPEGFLQLIGYATFLQSATDPFWLDRETALGLVQDSMNFRVSFGYNMQYSIVGRGLINALSSKGAFFQSPYPDYYAMNAMLLKAARILVCPFPLVTIGISPKSFGYFYFNKAEQQGVEFLKNLPDPEIFRRMASVVLPGTDMNTSWLIAMETLRLNYGFDADLRVNYRRYRMLQILQVYAMFAMDRKSARQVLRELWEKMSVTERRGGIVLGAMAMLAGLVPVSLRGKVINRLLALTGSHRAYAPKKIMGRYRNILEVHERIDPFASRAAPVESS